MNRKKFLQLTSLTTLGLFLGLDAQGSTGASGFIFSIGKPILHGRHGMFNLEGLSVKNRIQRDVMMRDGLDVLSKDRITTVKVTYESKELFQVLDSSLSSLHEKQLFGVKVGKGNPYILAPSMKKRIVFSECADFKLNNIRLKKTEGYMLESAEKQTITSQEEQFILVYTF